MNTFEKCLVAVSTSTYVRQQGVRSNQLNAGGNGVHKDLDQGEGLALLLTADAAKPNGELERQGINERRRTNIDRRMRQAQLGIIAAGDQGGNSLDPNVTKPNGE